MLIVVTKSLERSISQSDGNFTDGWVGILTCIVRTAPRCLDASGIDNSKNKHIEPRLGSLLEISPASPVSLAQLQPHVINILPGLDGDIIELLPEPRPLLGLLQHQTGQSHAK